MADMGFSDSSLWLQFLRGMLKPAAATVVVLMAVALSFVQRLGIEWEMVYAIARAFLQLSIIGFVLEFIFTQSNAAWIVLAYLFMEESMQVSQICNYGNDKVLQKKDIFGGSNEEQSLATSHILLPLPVESGLHIQVVVAGYTAGQRAKHIPHGNYIAGASILAGTSLTMLLLVVLNVFPFVPRYIIPVSGMMVGNAMTVTGVTMKKLREDLKIQKDLVEVALALGATPRQAINQQVKRSVIIAVSPVLDNAKTVGLISLPGAMTGLIMGGASPLEAVQLQVVVMNMLIGASTVSSIMSTYLCWPAFFTKAYQLEYQVFNAD